MKHPSEISIFIVDEDPLFQGICEKMLQNLGFTRITCFLNRHSFFGNIQKNPDIILLDYNMESQNGLDMLEKIKRYNINAPVVFLSGSEDRDAVSKSLKLDAFDYLIKNNINENKLQAVLEKAIELKTAVIRGYRRIIMRRVLSTIGMPAIVWIILETFFR